MLAHKESCPSRMEQDKCKMCKEDRKSYHHHPTDLSVCHHAQEKQKSAQRYEISIQHTDNVRLVEEIATKVKKLGKVVSTYLIARARAGHSIQDMAEFQRIHEEYGNMDQIRSSWDRIQPKVTEKPTEQEWTLAKPKTRASTSNR